MAKKKNEAQAAENNLLKFITERITTLGYSEPQLVEQDDTNVLVSYEDGRPAVCIYPLEKGKAIDTEQEQLAQLYSSQVDNGPADYVWVTNREMDYYFSWFSERQISELPPREEWQMAVKCTTSKPSPAKTEPGQYKALQKELDDLHEFIYAARENVNSKNDITYELCKMFFLKMHLEKNRDYVVLRIGKKLETILMVDYIKQNPTLAVEEIKQAFAEIKGLEDYNIKDDAGHSFRIFDSTDAVRLNKPETLKKIVELLNKYTLSNPHEQGLEDDILGRAFDVMLRRRFESKGGLGIYLTPQQGRDAAVEIVMHDIFSEDPNQVFKKDLTTGRRLFRILDLCSGSSGFLVTAMIEIRRRVKKLAISDEQKEEILKELYSDCFIGADNSPGMVLMARINMILHGDPQARVFKVDNSLDTDIFQPESIDLIITNPPFKKGGITTKDHEKLLSKFVSDIDNGRLLNQGDRLALGAKPDAKGKWKPVSSVDTAVLFIDRCLQLLKPGGRLMIVVPDGILCNSSDRYVREYIMGKKDEETGKFVGGKAIVKAVISLPPVFFQLSGAGAKTSLLYLQKKGPGVFEQGPIYMAVANEVGFEVKKNVEVTTGRNDLVKIVEGYKAGPTAGGS